MTSVFLKALLFLLVALPGISATAQQARPLVVMNLAAHPDDEDGRTLTYYRHAKNAVAYSVIYTRGEGGQNEIGPELYEALGAIRTVETERAARILGTQVHFLNFKDFGYSKHAREAFEKWGGRDLVTSRLVYLIRKLKPDVLFTNHDTVTVGQRRQHGHHQAVGISGYDAFTLAADPSYHPEQLREDGVDVWQPKRLFLRYWREPETYDVAVPVGDIDVETGKAYANRATIAIAEHASQGMGQFARRMQAEATYFSLIRSATDAPLSGTDLAGHLPPNTTTNPGLSYQIDAGRLSPLPAGSLYLSDSLAVPGQHVVVEWKAPLLAHTPLLLTLFGMVDATIPITPDGDTGLTFQVPSNMMPTLPRVQYQYERHLNHPPVSYALYDANTGSLKYAGHLPLEVAPPLVLGTSVETTRLRSGPNPISFRLEAYDPHIDTVNLDVVVQQLGSEVVVAAQHQTYQLKDRVMEDALTITLPANISTGTYTVTLQASSPQTASATQPAEASMTGRVFEVSVPEGLRVGIVQSYDNTLHLALKELGITPVLLDSLILARGDFKDLHTILVDIRAYLVRQDLRTHNDRLLEWVAEGGHLIVNYQKTFEWNEGNKDPFVEGQENPGTFAPYPLRLGRDRVTREDAPVTVLHPGHVLFEAPNSIDREGWDGWVQERGLYFPSEADDRYLSLFSMADPGEQPLMRSTLLASYGEGTYLYTALVWYRQLKVFHPGTYAMFANMVSLPVVDQRPSNATMD